MPDCVFCGIVSGQLPAHIVHEDDLCLAFLDIRPVRPGALMVIPKVHIDQFCDIPDALAAHIVIVAQRIARAVRIELNPRRVGMAVAGFGVPHAHLHIVPMHDDHDVTSGTYARSIDGKIVFHGEHVALADPAEQARLANRLRKSLD